MRYQLELDINAPRERVIGLFLDPDNLAKWQPDLVSFESLSDADPRAVGAKSRQIHRMGKREVEMIETITVHDYPDEFSAAYEADKVWNENANRFVELGDDKTKWIVDSEFKCSGFVGLLAFLMPGMFRKQTLTFVNRFKEFAENTGD